MAADLPHKAGQSTKKGTTKAQQASVLSHHSDCLWTHHIKMEVSETFSKLR